MTQNTSRRGFLGTSAALGSAFWVAPRSFAKPTRSALEGLTAACIGVGGKGSSDSSHISDHDVEIVGICDVDRRTLAKKAKEFDAAEQFTDFREMLDKLGDKVDIVTVSTPDHTHAAAAIKAMKMKKHVYCQKPLTWSIREARMMREVAAEMGVVTQMGNQGTSEDGLREAVEVIRSGAIGDVAEIHVWTNRPVWPQGIGRPAGEDPIPAELDWESWIGPAAMRPYKEGVYHSFNWRGWADFGTGALGDMACHTTNMPVMALELWDPIAVTAVKNPGIFENETYPGATTLMFEFPERNGKVACKFYWYDGGNLPSAELLAHLPEGFQKRIDVQKGGGKKTSAASGCRQQRHVAVRKRLRCGLFAAANGQVHRLQKAGAVIATDSIQRRHRRTPEVGVCPELPRGIRTWNNVEFWLCRAADRNDSCRQSGSAGWRRSTHRMGCKESG
jgi:predicted dehydrogenase